MNTLKWIEVGSGSYPLQIKNAEIIHTDISKFHDLETLCDAQHLPFKDEIFDVAYTSHVLEHVDNPIQVIQELKRVTKRLVIIKIPNVSFNRFIGEPHSHIYSWNEFTIRNLLKRFFKRVEIQYTIFFERGTGEFSKKIYLIKILLISLFAKESNELTIICYK
jgi:ubiquinone/menaquinone biosynthesis C-methylase UbiE